MRAIACDRYGSVDRLRLVEVPVPVPGRGEVLVRVRATSLNLSDWENLRGSPGYVRLMAPMRPRRGGILGSDIAGDVVALGSDVHDLAVGDAVYGDNLVNLGGFAEYAVAPAAMLARKPAGLGYVDASTIPQSGAIALHATSLGSPGARMLINGAGGGAGSFMIPLAKRAGVHVTGVDNAGKQDFMRDLGADAVLDYRATDYTRTGPYDLVVDLVASRSVFAARRALAPGGRFEVVGGTTRMLLRALTVGTVVGALSRRRIGVMLVRMGPEHVSRLADLVIAGEVRVHIDSVFPLEQAADAMERVGTGRALGKVVVQVADGAPRPGE